MFKISNSYKDDCECVLSLASRCFEIRSTQSLDTSDVRIQALNNVEKLSNASMAILNLLDTWAINPPQVQYQVQRMLGLQSHQYAKELARTISKMQKLAQITLCHFAIENLLRTLVRSMGISAHLSKYYRITKALIEALELDSSLTGELMVPAYIRNTLHNNGLHKWNSCDFEINGVHYEFKQNEHLECATWPHIAHVLENSANIIATIYGHSRVCTIPSPLLDEATKVRNNSK